VASLNALGIYLLGNLRFTGVSSNRWTSLSMLIGSGNLYPVLRDTARSCRGIFQCA